MNGSAPSTRRRWLTFAAIAVGTFIAVLDQSALGIALPEVADHFDASIPAVQWVTLAYMLTTGALLLPMGRLADMVGRRRLYILGFVIFTVSAVFTGSSTSLVALIGFKAVQGVGAAMGQATAMAIVTSAFPAAERGKVIGTYMTVVGLGAIAGPVFGGVVVNALDWRYVFLGGVPLGAVAVALSFAIHDSHPVDGRDGSARRGFDWLGAGLAASMVVLFLLVMTNAYRVGWDSPVVSAASVAVVAMFVSFVWWERRAEDPMLDLALFRTRVFSMGTSAMYLTFLAGTAVFFLMPFYLQKVLGFAPSKAGLIMVPTAIFFALAGPLAGRLSDRYGWRAFVVAGPVLSLVSLLALSRIDESTAVWMVMTALVIQGLGMGLFYSPNASAILSTVDLRRYGVATAFLNMVRNTGTVTGIALSTTIVTASMSAQGFEPNLDAVTSAGGDAVRAAFTDGLRKAYLAMSAVAVGAMVLGIVQGRSAAKTEAEVKAEPEQERELATKT
ncbi:MAG: MFS transporter [Chloroflexi bacterium]|nr:MFS transporter [Chloroflexota bacterium]